MDSYYYKEFSTKVIISYNTCTLLCEKPGKNIHELVNRFWHSDDFHFLSRLRISPIDGSYIIEKNKLITKTRKAINAGEFHDYLLLDSVILNDGLQTIETGAFYDCYRIKEIYIPSTVTFIGKNAFRNNSFRNYMGYESEKAKVYIDSKSPIKKLTKEELLDRFNDNSTFFLINTIIRTSDISNINIESYEPFYIDGLELIVDSYFTDDDIDILSKLKIINKMKITIDKNYKVNLDNIYKLSKKMYPKIEIIYPEDLQVIKTSELSKNKIDVFNKFNIETLKLIIDSYFTEDDIDILSKLKKISKMIIIIDKNYKINLDDIYKLSKEMHPKTEIIYPEDILKDIQEDLQVIKTSELSKNKIDVFNKFNIETLKLIVDSYFTDDDIDILSKLKIINKMIIIIDKNYKINLDDIYKLSKKMHSGTKIIYPEDILKDIQVKTSDLSKMNIDVFNEFNIETLKLIVDSDLTKENILLINNFKYLRYLNVSNITEEERNYILQYLKSNIILYNYINDENIELSFNGGVLSNGIEYEFNKNKIISMNIYVDKNFKISKLNKFLELNTFDNLRNITIIGASGIKQVFIALRMFCPENVILTFRDKKFIEEIKHNSNSPKLDNTDNLVIDSEIDYLKKEIIKIATKSNSMIKEKILHKLNELISEYNTNIDEYNKKDEEVLTLMPNYISIDIDILTRLKRLYESLSDKNYLIDLLNKIQDKNISIIKDIEALLNKMSSIDKELVYSMIDEILNKYKLLIEKDISIENKDVNLTLNNYNYEVEMDKELINILEILNSYYYEVKKYYTELDKINYYIDLLNDNKQIVIRDNIVDLITLLKTTNTKEVIIEFKKILDRYVCVLKDTMENIKERYLLNKSVNVEDVINIKLDFLQDVKKWLKNFGLIIQLDKIYDVLNKRDSNIIKLDIGLDYGVCIYDLIKEINNLLEHTQLNEIIYNKINELLEEYKMIIQTKDNKEILKAQRNIISELCKIKTDIEINIKKEGTTRQHIQLVKI